MPVAIRSTVRRMIMTVGEVPAEPSCSTTLKSSVFAQIAFAKPPLRRQHLLDWSHTLTEVSVARTGDAMITDLHGVWGQVRMQ